MEERRKIERSQSHERVILKPKDGSSRSFEGELVDLNVIGMGVYASDKIDIGVETEFEIISTVLVQPITGVGRIRYSLPLKQFNPPNYRIGLEFIKIEKEAIERILTSIQKEQ